MDTSKEYIEMCKKAFEIYDGRYFIVGDFLLTKSTEFIESYVEIFAEHDCCGGDLCYGRKFNLVVNEEVECWLPRQDQLQEMVTDKKSDQKNCKLWYSFKKYITDIILNSDELELPSWEQLWLSFVMKEKYNKIWINNDWKVENEN